MLLCARTLCAVYTDMATRCVQPPAPSTQHLESAARGRRPLEERHDAHARTLYGPSGTLPLLDHVYRPVTGEFCIQNPLVIARRECGISRCPKPSPSLAMDLHAACGSAPCLSLSLALHPHPHAHVPSRARQDQRTVLPRLL